MDRSVADWSVDALVVLDTSKETNPAESMVPSLAAGSFASIEGTNENGWMGCSGGPGLVEESVGNGGKLATEDWERKDDPGSMPYRFASIMELICSSEGAVMERLGIPL